MISLHFGTANWGVYICVSLITYWLQHSCLQATMCGWKFVENIFFCDSWAPSDHIIISCFSALESFFCITQRLRSESAVWNGAYKQEMTSRARKSSTMLSLAHWCPRHAASVEVLFSTKVQLYQIWIYFYSKVQHIPSASDYIKTYNVHTVDISALPFTVSGLNRHYFSGFSSLQQIIKLKKASKKENDKCLHMMTKDMNTVSDVFLW